MTVEYALMAMDEVGRATELRAALQAPPDDGVVHHFTIHDGDGDVPALLERVRVAIIGRGAINVYHMTFTDHHDGSERVAEITVYYSPSNGRGDLE